MTTEERLRRLERELSWANRCNRWLLVGIAVAAVAGFLLAWVEGGVLMASQGQQGVAEEIRANAFVLVDDAGRVRAELSVNQIGVSVDLYDEAGTIRTQLVATEALAGLLLHDEAGTRRAGLTTSQQDLGPFGSSDSTVLDLLDNSGTERVLLHVGENSGAGLLLQDEAGLYRASLGSSERVRADGRRTTYPESSLLLFGPDGNVIWQAPQ